MPILACKLLLTPLLIAAVTFATRHWGPVIGGCLIALPISGGPITFFMTLEQGVEFGTVAAAGNVLGMSAVALFCLAYVKASRFGCLAAALAALVAFFGTVKLLSCLDWGLLPSALLAGALLGLAYLGGGREQAEKHTYQAPWWDIPFRIIAATGLLLGITGAAALMGPEMSGLLAVFPIFTFVIALFTHRQYGAGTARRLMLGIVLGCYCSLAFFIVVALMMPYFSLPLVYLAATLVCVSIDLILMRLARNR